MLWRSANGGQAGGICSGCGTAGHKAIPPRGVPILEPSNTGKSHSNAELLFEGSCFPAQLTKVDLGFRGYGNADQNRSALNLYVHASNRLGLTGIQRYGDTQQCGQLPDERAVRLREGTI